MTDLQAKALKYQRLAVHGSYISAVSAWVSVALGAHMMIFGAILMSVATAINRRILRNMEARHPYARLLK